MARNESDREDLLAEAVSLITRIEIRDPTRQQPVVVGVNQQGWLFVYLGSDPMYRFDEQGRLRRGFVDGRLYRTSGSTLAELVRHRSDVSNDPAFKAESMLLRRDLTATELQQFCQRMTNELKQLADILNDDVISRQYPAKVEGLAQQMQAKLHRVLESDEFLAPAIVNR